MKLKAAVERDCGYGSTKNIAIAVASDDPGVTLDDGSYVNMAQEVMDDLAAKTTIHWIVTDSVQKAIDGVYAGDTYAAVILSEDFTARMTDLSTAVSSGGAGMTYYENGKKNAVASKITQTAVTSLQQDVRAKYLGNLFSQLYSDTTELTGSANIAQAAGQVSQHIAALGQNRLPGICHQGTGLVIKRQRLIQAARHHALHRSKGFQLRFREIPHHLAAVNALCLLHVQQHDLHGKRPFPFVTKFSIIEKIQQRKQEDFSYGMDRYPNYRTAAVCRNRRSDCYHGIQRRHLY